MNTPPPLPKGSPPPIPQASVPTKPKDRLTAAGVVLMLATIIATAAGGIFCAFWLFPRVLPGGRYPVLLLAVPIVGCGVAVGAGGTWLCKLLRIAITVPIDKNSDNENRVA